MVIEDVQINEDEELSDAVSVDSAIGNEERRMRRSVLAYLMYHSGYIYTEDPGTDSTMRANIIDDNGSSAIKRLEELDIPIVEHRINAVSSIRKQITLSPKRAVPICYIDVDAINSEVILPVKQPSDTIISTPQEIAATGVTFEDYKDFRDSYNRLASYIVSAPKSVLFWFQRFESLFLNIADPRLEEWSKFHKIRPEWRFINPPMHTFRDFEALSKAGDVGRLVSIHGQVVEKGDVKTVLTHIAFRCITKNTFDVECGTIQLVEQDVERGEMVKPSKCYHCEAQKPKFVKLDSQESKSEAIQRLTIQQEQVSSDSKQIMVELRGDLCDTIEAGTAVSLVGMMRLEPMTKNGLICSHYILVSSIGEKTSSSAEINLTKKDLEEIQAFEDSVDIEEKMDLVTKGWAGHIHGVEEIKKAFTLVAVGGTANEQFGLRPQMHSLIIGDPGTVKSKLLDAVRKIVPGSRITDASAATGAGLTGACVQQEDLYTNKKRWVIQPGEIPLTPEGAICAIDELNLYKYDLGDVNLAMESGMVVISKVVKGRLPVKCAIIAAANPDSKHAKRKKFNKMLPLNEQIDMDFTLLQRFDMVFIILDTANEDKDKKIARAMLKGVVVEEDETIISSNDITIDVPFIIKLLEVCRNREAKLSKKAADYIVTQHAKKRSEATTDEELRSHRQVAALYRLTIAAAKFDGVNVATLKHVKFAEDIMSHTLQEQDPAAMEGGLTQSDRSVRERVAETFVKLIGDGFMLNDREFNEIYSKMKDTWDDIPPMDIIEGVMREFSRDSATTNIHRSRKGIYSYEGTNNPAWQVW
tara:strand:+ start:19113 stop:21545 length:2433 start_codon:yes stop_codon:yes gene_type:complete